MNRLTCEQAFRRLDDYVDRELTEEERAEVQAHLEVCAMCAVEFDTERRLLEMIREKLQRIRLPEGLLARIRASLTGPGRT